ncbi:MAG TPA: SURF1 family protein [Longimicrobiales bacterium]|nr:SURF1 family protein [Longimicrobiales bacterium]
MVSQYTTRPAPRAITITPAGIAATIIIATVIIVFVRLGSWQLDRLQERRALNARIEARLQAPPLHDATALHDTAGLHYRIISLHGRLDNDRSIILPGRSLRGVPGVHLLTPLLLAERTDAVLVNRGWIASADAASVDLSRLQLRDTAAVRGLVLPFPSPAASLALRDSVRSTAEFRRVWFTIDERALRAQFPYDLLPATVQELPDAAAPAGSPIRLEPPPLNDGSHLGYALQWFSFALIALVGWIAIVLRSRAPRRTAPLLLGMLLALGAHPVHAQLRPLEPFDWRIFDDGFVVSAAAGMGMLWGQRASLAGSEGRLIEGGIYELTARSDRMAVTASGTAVWHFVETRQTGPPAHGVLAASDGVRSEVGVATVATAVDLSLPRWTTGLVLRFGATIPTTSDESGLDRDRTDFFATIAVHHPLGPLSLWMENGVGINGTTSSEYPQSDVWNYAFGASYALRTVRPSALLVGRQDGHSWIVRGNEDLRELRFGIEAGHQRWIAIHYIRGLTAYSPRHGFRVGAGAVIGTHR